MEDIQVNSAIDRKTYFNIRMLVGFGPRLILVMVIFVGAVSYYTMSGSSLQLWMKILIALIIFCAYFGLIVLLMYFSCRKRMRQSAFLNEPLQYTLNEKEIVLKGRTISSVTGWQYMVKLMERKEYFLLMPSAKSFHYLPKAGFQLAEDIARFKNLVKEKGIKITYH